jgi:hypothetical protein
MMPVRSTIEFVITKIFCDGHRFGRTLEAFSRGVGEGMAGAVAGASSQRLKSC